MIVKGLFIYPVKGIKGVPVSSAKVEKNGLEHDRSYMLADLDGQMISQRNHSELTQLFPRRLDGAWLIAYKGEEIKLEDNSFSPTQIEVEVWGSRFMANEVSKEVSEWFSSRLNIPCSLVVMPHKASRIKEFKKAPYSTSLSFADGYPILTLGTASLNHLNEKLSESITEDRFRPNIIIETTAAHEEDEWGDFKIGEYVSCRNIKPCVRCQVITINQDTGVQGKEPTKTLASYRKFENGIYFGSNVVVMSEGNIKVGDKIELLG